MFRIAEKFPLMLLRSDYSVRFTDWTVE